MSTASSEALKSKAVLKKTVKKMVTAKESSDLIAAISHQMESLTKDEAFGLVDSLLNTADEYDIRLGGALSAIIKNKWYQKDDEDKTLFDEFILKTYGFKGRKARYLASIYDDLIESGVAWTQVEGIGWTKLRIIAPVLTVKNVEKWVKLGKTKTRLALIEAVEKAQLGKLDKSGLEPGMGEVKTTVNRNFKVHKDAVETVDLAIDKAKKEAETEFPGVALEAICQSYLNTGKKKLHPMGLVETLKQHEVNDVISAVNKVWPDLNFGVDLPEGTAIEE